MTSTKREALVRRAQSGEAEALNELITRSKSYWGYDHSFVEAYRSFLSLSPEAIEHHPVYCAKVGGHACTPAIPLRRRPSPPPWSLTARLSVGVPTADRSPAGCVSG